MNLLRNNPYLVVLIVVTLVVGGVFLYLGGGKAGQIEEMQMKPRLKMSRSLWQLRRPPRANAGTIAGKETRNKLAEKELNDVKANLTAYNRRNFRVGSLKLLDGKLRPVLPYDSSVWRENVLALPYIQSYHNSLKGFLRKLGAISTPTDRVIAREAAGLQTRFDREERVREKNTAPVAAKKTTKRASKRAAKITPRAYQQAANKVKLINARRGQIYATKNCFDIRLTDMNQSQLTADEVWESQLSAWVQQDIVDALVRTNEEVQNSLNIPKNKRCVINSAVKRLVRIEISGQSGKASAKGEGKPRVDTMMGPMMPGMMPVRGRDRKTDRDREDSEDSDGKIEPADSLTGNTANKMMDVVNYSFTVVISTRYLPVLEKKLIEQNFHVILNESIESYTSIASAPPSKDGNYSEEELSYYGVAPVSLVTITGQLVLLTDWIRGTYDTKAKVWTNNPLMPVSVMEKLPSAARRKQDAELVDKKLPRPWEPGFVPEKPRENSRKKSRRRRR